MRIIREEIKKELINLEFNLSNVVTLYLIDAIEIVLDSKNMAKTLLNLEKNVYSKVAIKYYQNPNTVKSDIVKATNKINEIRDLKNTKNIPLSKLTAKMIIMDIADKIRSKHKHCK